MTGQLTINDTVVRFAIDQNVSYNRANSHRLSAVCACGVQFVSLACSDKVSKYGLGFIRQRFQTHQAEGSCRLVTTSDK